ncbi:hypothetical protein Hanom_Chr11g01011561 [Helianthus anomalus]
MIFHSLIQISGDVSYNGYKLEEFVPQRTAVYISQNDLHISEMTVRETLDFSSRCQGTGNAPLAVCAYNVYICVGHRGAKVKVH